MNWFDDAEKKNLEIRERAASVSQHAEGVYGLLWNELKKEVSDLERDKNLSLYTNGSSLDCVIGSYRASDATKKKKQEVHVKLTNDRTKIVASILGVVLVEFVIDVGEDNVVHLKHGTEKPSIQEAAILILRNFLFPDVP